MSQNVSFNEKDPILRQKRKKNQSLLVRIFIKLHIAGDERGAKVAMIALTLAMLVATGYDVWAAFGPQVQSSFTPNQEVVDAF